MANHIRAELVNQPLAMAICQRQPAASLIMHTDCGSQYGVNSYRQLLAQHGMQPSMIWKGGVIALFPAARTGNGKRRLLRRGAFGEMVETYAPNTNSEPLDDPSDANQNPVDNDL
jgi:hypothetical protein